MSGQSPFIAKLTQWLGYRRHRMWLRYKDDISSRTIPKPNMPPSENSAISNNYYCSRDARRQMAPPTIVKATGMTQKRLEAQKQLEDGDSKNVAKTESKTSSSSFPTPGLGLKWTQSNEQGW